MNKNLNPDHTDISKKTDIPCGVIQDLLILYEDNVCTEESSSFIREHIKDCDNCRKAYEQAARPLPPITSNQEDENKEEVRFIKTLRKYQKKLTLLNILIVSFFLVVIAALLKIGWTEFLESGIFSVAADDVQITELYQLAGGDIYCTLNVPKLINAPTLNALQINDRASGKNDGYYELHFQYPLSIDEEKYIYVDTISLIFPKKVPGDIYLYPDSGTYSCTSIYYCGKNKNDRLVIWEEGQTLEQAPEQIEKKAIQAYKNDGNIPKSLGEIKAIGKTLSQDELTRYFTDYYQDWDSIDCFPVHVE